MYKITLKDFILKNSDWEKLLTTDPYNLKISRDDGYILFKYNQLSSDFSLPIVREARGIIFKENNWDCVCRAFDKFGNYGESYVPKLNWEAAFVEEKVDGSLIKIWYHNGKWRISTNNTINAENAKINDDISFKDLVLEAINNDMSFFDNLMPWNTYLFELVSPKSQVTIFYPETKLYYLGQRDMTSMVESKTYLPWMAKYNIQKPKVYALNSLENCLNCVQSMTRDEEGLVVADDNFNRVKIKSPEYLLAFHMVNNNVITIDRVINMIKMETIDDFKAYCPRYQYLAEEVENKLKTICAQLDATWGEFSQIAVSTDRKAFSQIVFASKTQYSDYIFKKYSNPELKAYDYLINQKNKRLKLFMKTI